MTAATLFDHARGWGDFAGEASQAAEPATEPITEPLSRRTDPESSREAARTSRAAVAGQQALVLDTVRRLPGRTASEIAAQLDGPGGLDRVQVNRRTADLERAGLIDKGERRKSRVTGRSECTWWPAGPTAGAAA